MSRSSKRSTTIDRLIVRTDLSGLEADSLQGSTGNVVFGGELAQATDDPEKKEKRWGGGVGGQKHFISGTLLALRRKKSQSNLHKGTESGTTVQTVNWMYSRNVTHTWAVFCMI